MYKSERLIKSNKMRQPTPGGGDLVDAMNTSNMLDEQLENEVLNYSGEKAPIKKALNDLQFWMEGNPDNMSNDEIREAGGLEAITRDRIPDFSGSRNNSPRPVLRARIGKAYDDYGPTSDQEMVPPTKQEWDASVELTRSKQNQRAYNKRKEGDGTSSGKAAVVQKRSEQAANLRSRGRTAQAKVLEDANAQEEANPGSTTRDTVATNSGNDRAYRVLPASPKVIGSAWLRSSNAEARRAGGGLTPAEQATVGALVEDKNKRIQNMMTTPPGGRPTRTTGGGRVGRGEVTPDNVVATRITVPLRRLQQETNEIENLQGQVDALSGKADKDSVTAKRDLRARINTRKRGTSEKVSTYNILGKDGKVVQPNKYVVADVNSVEPLNQGLNVEGVGQYPSNRELKALPESQGVPSGVVQRSTRSRGYAMRNTNRFGKDYGKPTGERGSYPVRSQGNPTPQPTTAPAMSYGNTRALRVQGNQLAAALMSDNLPKASGGYGQVAQRGIQNAMTPQIEEYQAWRSRNKKAAL
jgi:hypothetical protein